MSDLLDGKAEIIVNALKYVLASCEQSVEYLSSFGSDGARVMVGSRSGVAAHLRELNPGILNIYCVAHCLELATAQAGNQIPYLKKVKDWLAEAFALLPSASSKSGVGTVSPAT